MSNVLNELRHCDRCLVKTEHKVINEEDVTYNPRGRTLYKCTKCGRTRRMRMLRPSSEVSY